MFNSPKKIAKKSDLTFLRVYLGSENALDIFIQWADETQTKMIVNTTIASSSEFWLGSYIATVLDLKWRWHPMGIFMDLDHEEGLEEKIKAMVDNLGKAVFKKERYLLKFCVYIEDRTKAQVNWWESLSFHLKMYHGDLTIDDIEPTSSPGYWQIKKPCGGEGICRNPWHYRLGNEGPMHHAIFYLDETRVNGRVSSPYRTWSAHKKEVELINANADSTAG